MLSIEGYYTTSSKSSFIILVLYSLKEISTVLSESLLNKFLLLIDPKTQADIAFLSLLSTSRHHTSYSMNDLGISVPCLVIHG